jgi:hypothetical protein
MMYAWSVPPPFSFSLDNTMSRWTAKVVVIEFQAGTDIQLEPEAPELPAETPKLTEAKLKLYNMQKIMNTIMHEVREMEIQHDQLQYRLTFHIDQAVSDASSVIWYAALEAGVAVGLSIFNFVFVTKWFSNYMGGNNRV